MPRITTADVSNFGESMEPAGYITQHGTFEPHWPPKHRVSVSAPNGVSVIQSPSLPLPPKSAPKADHVAYAVSQLGVSQGDAEGMTVRDLVALARPGEDEEEGEQPSAGMSSSTSGSKPAKSGSSAPATEPSTPSPVPSAESPSGKGQATKPARSSSVSSTDGSSQGTGASQQSRSSSSAAGQGTQATDQSGEDPK